MEGKKFFNAGNILGMISIVATIGFGAAPFLANMDGRIVFSIVCFIIAGSLSILLTVRAVRFINENKRLKEERLKKIEASIAELLSTAEKFETASLSDRVKSLENTVSELKKFISEHRSAITHVKEYFKK